MTSERGEPGQQRVVVAPDGFPGEAAIGPKWVAGSKGLLLRLGVDLRVVIRRGDVSVTEGWGAKVTDLPPRNSDDLGPTNLTSSRDLRQQGDMAMKKSKFTEAQVAAALREVATGTQVGQRRLLRSTPRGR
jgi:hypothetical protein